MNKRLWFFSLLAAFLIPTPASAQKMERTKNWEVGDKLTYTYTFADWSAHVVEQVVEVTEAEVRTTQNIGDVQRHEGAYSTADMSRMKGVCLANGEQCEFSPGEAWVRFPLEKGKSWSSSMAVTGDTFYSETSQERKVLAVEKVTTAAGEFQAYKVSSTGRIKVRRKSGEGPWEGTESATYWWTAIKGKLVLLKQEYQNSFGARSSRELLSAELK